MADINSVIYDVIAAKKNVYIYFTMICSDLHKLKRAEPFTRGQIEKLVSLYLDKLTNRGLLVKISNERGVRYKRTELFYKELNLMKAESILKHNFLSSLEMQKALCNFELMEFKSKIDPFIMDTIRELTLEKEKQLDYLIKKEKVYLLHSKLNTINKLLDIYKLERFSIKL